MSEQQPFIALTMGDPAGIGPEVTLKAVATDRVHEAAKVVVLGDYDHLTGLADRLDIDVDLRRVDSIDAVTAGRPVDVIDFDNVTDFEYGDLRAENGRVSLEYVERSIDLAISGEVDGLCNAPIHKQAINMAGSEYAGHTDMMADRTDTERYTALLTDGDINVTHLSIHVPLSEAIERVTEENVLDAIRVTHERMPEAGIEDPSLGVVGINPHAGDGGVIGTLDDEEIAPAVERAREEGIDAEGPLPPDSAFNRALDDDYDCMVAMYHDQGHIPLFVNSHVEGGGVGATVLILGFPFVRATTLHGTAYDIAGRGIAAPHSMITGITLAADAVRHGS
ncbi:4-hydroxythreonine-4-phosphate dehydrogenase PdxA [Halobellus marinus]|uniref:4-hydroxythreonine-4-phosphate dehydrogenase PdxA n=1 Tax=Halobellus TaxID=1073986 RepID=UPI0028ACF216|nr:4-hydroxythreonine-4-phosphate dehydrogenase PdxA [Halobellus sp. DFY28]